MKHIETDDFVKSLLESDVWTTVDACDPLNEKKDTGASKGDKGKDEDDPEAKDYERGGDREGDEGAGEDKGDKPDFSTKARKGDKSKTKKGKDYEGDDEDDDNGNGKKETTSHDLALELLENLHPKVIIEFVEALKGKLISEADSEENVSEIKDVLGTIESFLKELYNT